jgi:hypothetical protein
MTVFRPELAKPGTGISAAHVYATPIGNDRDDAARPFFERPEWHQRAACADVHTDVFFPTRGQDTRPAKAICATCSVRDECLEWALDNVDQHGVWGGKSERERRGMRIARNRARRANLIA